MIGGISKDADISAYVSKEELDKTLCTPITGIIVNLRYWKRQGNLYLMLKEEPEKNKNGLRIGVHNSDWTERKEKEWTVDLYFGEAECKEVIRKGRLILKYESGYGSSIGIYDSSRLQPDEEEVLRKLEFYRDNKSKTSRMSK